METKRTPRYSGVTVLERSRRAAAVVSREAPAVDVDAATARRRTEAFVARVLVRAVTKLHGAFKMRGAGVLLYISATSSPD